MEPPLEDQALIALLARLREQDYQFITPTPLTHSRVLANRAPRLASSLREVFGWSMPFTLRERPAGLSDELLALLRQAGVLETVRADAGGSAESCFRSAVRCSSFDDALFLHSAYPTEDQNAVFFGPDTYRFLRLIQGNLPAHDPLAPLRVLDIGCGSGAGGILAARLCAGARLFLNDINPLALRYAAINARALALNAELAPGDALDAVSGHFDLIVSNPPYLVDDAARAYRHGGDELGRALSLKFAVQSLQRLAPLGRLILYTGVAMLDGVDPFLQALRPALAEAGCVWTYQEIDPDVFGEELERPVYRAVDRIAAVGLVAVKA